MSTGQPQESKVARRLAGLFSRARKHLEDQVHEAAVGVLEEALELDPGNRDAAEILTRLRRELELVPRRGEIEALFDAAQAALEAGRYRRLESLADRILDLDSENDRAVELLNEAYDRPGDDPQRMADELAVSAITAEHADQGSTDLLIRVDELLGAAKMDRKRRNGAVAEALPEMVRLLEKKRPRAVARLLYELDAAETLGGDLDGIRERLALAETEIRQRAGEAARRIEGSQLEEAEELLAGLEQEHPTVVKAIEQLATARHEKSLEEQRGQAAAALQRKIRHSIDLGELSEAVSVLADAPGGVLSQAESDQLEGEIHEAQLRKQRTAQSLVAAQGLLGMGSAQGAIGELEAAAKADPGNRDVAVLLTHARSQVEAQQAAAIATADAKPAGSGLGLRLVVGVVLVVGVLAVIASLGGDSKTPPPPPAGIRPPDTGSLIVELSSIGRAYLGFEVPTGGAGDRKTHVFEEVAARSYILKVCRPGDQRCSQKVEKHVSVEAGKVKNEEVQVPW